MPGAMQHWPLRVNQLIDYAAREHGPREIVTRWADGTESRDTWASVRHDALRMTQALGRMGVRQNDRVATLAMNHGRHLASWFGAIGSGAILHTINPRLFDDQLEYIVNHAEDRVLIYDAAFQPLVDRLRPKWPTIEHYICFDSCEAAPAFPEWIGREDGDGAWQGGDERDPCMLCYTSGTTGNPKGVLYEHRSTMFHAVAACQPSILDMEPRSVVFPVVPMFHAASWGMPWAAAATGAKYVCSVSNDAAVLLELMRREGVTHAAGVPTIWLNIFQHLDATGEQLPPIRHALSGGSALPSATIARLMHAGVNVAHAWGMTETSPIVTVASEPANWDEMDFEAKLAYKAMQGRARFGTELRAVDLDDHTKELPRDGRTPGALQVRGPWVIQRYFKAEADAVDEDGWFDTGDVAIIHPDGTLQLTDRTKDVIKSGGEWISSVELENAAIGHPAVAEAAAIGVPHPKWDERPLLVVVRKPGSEVSAEEILAFLQDKIARWWLPDAVEFVDELPHTGTGKISKKDLRDQFAGYRLEG